MTASLAQYGLEIAKSLAEARKEIARLRAENAELREKLDGWVRAHEIRPDDLPFAEEDTTDD